jgi:hypothetical protein
MAVCPKELGKRLAMQIEQARLEHESIILRLMRSINDSDGAMRTAEAVLGLPYWLQQNLRHKKRATSEFASQVHCAWLAMLEQSVRRDLETLQQNASELNADTVARLGAEGKNLVADIQAAKAVVK